MLIQIDFITCLKSLGAILTASGSMLLAWRVKSILDWVVNTLVAHEQSITQLRKILSGVPQDEALIEGVTKHLLDVQSKVGLSLLVSGFILLGLGMLFQAASYVIVAF
ncbi:MAG TPA: hypothetical protein DEQ23_05015 [Chlorobium sp.]|nr:hypothetical protein [Chlorobium sp.]